MYNREVKYKNCEKGKSQVRTEKTRAESQKYKCKHCEKICTPSPKKRTYSEDIQAIKLYMKENGKKSVGRILGISNHITYTG